ncbi:hypothetical protein [Shewanella baltica]|uniref:hypothetical protein n=1 Tax=Shewanella TaxID=22 RepID=UPI00217E2D5C|nr:hypothetical protein [Shewanella baltica]MCS6102341.1 hypothetical protein [Shewanella baltica]MCS6185525.1 hypothetical protein [Shewanella baltica]
MITLETYLKIRVNLYEDAKKSIRMCTAWRRKDDFYNYGEGFCRDQMTRKLNKAADLRRLIMRLDAEFFGGAR